MLEFPFIYVWLAMAFVLGCAIGSWLNVCIYRLPYEKSILWPLSSHCGKCFQPIRGHDNIPLLSYLLLGGRCRHCGQTFSARYFLVELLTGLLFALLFYLDVVENVFAIPAYESARPSIRNGAVPLNAWAFWVCHATLLGFLLVASVCDLDHMEIPLNLTITGTLVGLVISTLCPWPWPASLIDLQLARRLSPDHPVPLLGFHPWPVWKPSELPAWMAPGTWQLGLATGLAGVAAGILVLRVVRFVFGVGRGIEGLGVGDADLMMMAGAFLGWQVVLAAFFVSVFPALVLGIVQIIRRGDEPMPFGPSLALGILITLYGWRWIGPRLEMIFFDSTMMAVLAGMGVLFLLLASLALRLLRGTPEGAAR